MRKCSLLFLFSVAIVSSSCMSSLYSPFKIVDSDYKPNGNKVAVISGLFKKDTVLFTTKFEKELEKCSKYNVKSQNNIKQKLGSYPIKVKGPYKMALKKIEHDYTNTDVKTLISMGKKLNVDYIYAIWAPNLEYAPDFSIYQLHTIMQVFEVSSGKEIANSKFPISWQTKGSSAGAKLPRNKNDAMNTIAAKLSKHIAEQMGMLK